MKCSNCGEKIRNNWKTTILEKCEDCGGKIYENNKIKYKTFSTINVVICLAIFVLIRNFANVFDIGRFTYEVISFLCAFGVLCILQNALQQIMFCDESEFIKSVVKAVTAIALAVAIIAVLSAKLYVEYKNSYNLDDVEIKDIVIKEWNDDLKNVRIVDEEKEGEGVAYFISYSLYEEEQIGCVYFEKSNIFEDRYFFEGGSIGTPRGELGYYSLSSVGYDRLVVYGLDLPDEAVKYQIDFIDEEDTKLIVDIKDNTVFELYMLKKDTDSYINCFVDLLDSNYKEIKSYN